MNQTIDPPLSAARTLPDESAAPPTIVRWQIFGLSCQTSWMLYLHRYTFALLKSRLADEWGVSIKSLGAMDATFYVPYLIFQVPCGLLADRFGTRIVLGAIILAWSGVFGLHAWAPGLSAMFVLRALFGATQAGCYPALGKVTQKWFPLAIRTSLQGWIASFSGRMGAATAFLFVAPVLFGMLDMPWRTAVVLLSAIGMLLGVAVLVVFRDSPAAHPRVNAAELALIRSVPYEEPEATAFDAQTSAPNALESAESATGTVGEPWWQRLTLRSAANMGFFLAHYLGATFADVVYTTWLPYMLQDKHDASDMAMGFYSSLPLFGGALGGMLGGYLNDFLIPRLGRRWARSLIGFTGNMIACLMVLAALSQFHHAAAFSVLLFCAKLFSDWDQPTVWGTVTDISGQHAGTIFGLVNGLGGIGAPIGAFVIPLIAQDYSWELAIAMIAGTYLMTGMFWLAINCTVPVLRPQR